jgi:cytoskeletal protein RodZ
VVVLAVLAAVVIVGSRTPKHTTTPTTRPTTRPSTTRRTSPTTRPTTTRPSTTTRVTTTTRPAGHRTGTTSTTTTVPARFVAVTSSATTATYTPPADTYTLTLHTTVGDCWVTVSGSSGATLFSTTLAPDQSKQLSVTGAVTVIIGAPSTLVVTLDHEPVVLPSGFQTPFTMTLQPA